MKRIREHTTVFTALLLSYFLLFVVYIQLPFAHNLQADVHYNQLGKYGEAEEDIDCIPKNGETHIHHCIKFLPQYCYICNIINPQSIESTGFIFVCFCQPENMQNNPYDSADFASVTIRFPTLRAPPVQV